MRKINLDARRVPFAGVLLLVVFGLALNLPFFHFREFQGEEGRRVIIAQEMINTGDWIVPHVEGEIYLGKPPFFNWILATSFSAAGRPSEAAARMVSIAAALVCAICLSLFWKFTAGVPNLWFVLPGLIFLTFPDVIDKAIRAEIDMTFTCLVTMSLLSWFYLHEVRRKPLSAWISSLSFVGLGVLTKGVQAPAFFYCAVIPWLIMDKRMKDFFSSRHLTGIMAGAIVVSLWLIPLSDKVDLFELVRVWTHEIAIRKEPLEKGAGFMSHLVTFPAEYVTGYLPWLPLLALWIYKPIRNGRSVISNLAWFCVLPVILSVPIYWLLPGARVRYILPLSGLLALLITIPLDSVIQQRTGAKGWFKLYAGFIGLALVCCVLSFPFLARRFEISVPVILLALCLGCLLLNGLALLKSLSPAAIAGLFASAALVAKLLWAAVYFPYHSEHLSHSRAAAAKINGLLSRDTQLYDYGVDNAHLAYYLDRPVRMIRSLHDRNLDRNGAVIMKKEAARDADKDGLKFVGEVSARRAVLYVYRLPGSNPGTK